MSATFDGLDVQDLGDNFVFEPDSQSLQRILDNRELSPRSVLALRMSMKLQQSKMTPIKAAPKEARQQPKNFNFFASQNGSLFCKPKTPRSKANAGIFGSTEKAAPGGGGGGGQRVRALGRCKLTALPQRGGGGGNLPDGSRLAFSGRKPLRSANANINPAGAKNKGRRSCVPAFASQNPNTEKKMLPFLLPPPRQSISERKAIPFLDRIPARPTHNQQNVSARKELDFEQIVEDEDKENNTDTKSSTDSSEEFAKPLPVVSKLKVNKAEENKSLAQTILMRESLAGLPRASLSGLLRQSLSVAELDRMFEDDSTQSFEALEMRLKTPGKSKSASRLKTPAKPEPRKLQPEAEEDLTVQFKVPQQVISENVPLKSKDDVPPKPIETVEQSPMVEGGEVAVENMEVQSGEQGKNKIIVEEPEPDQCVQEKDVAVADEEDQQKQQPELEGLPELEEGVEKIEIFEYEIEDSMLDDEAIEQRLLQKSMSMVNISICEGEDKKDESSAENKKEDEGVILLAKSTSLTDLAELNDLNPSAEFLKDALEDLEKHRQEQAAIDRQIQDLMTLGRKRREEFKAVWGVSPMSINQKRTVKTAINVQKVQFSVPDNEPEPEDGAHLEPETEDSNVIGSDQVFFGQEDSEDHLEHEVDNDNESIDFGDNIFQDPIDTDLFLHYIDANFASAGVNISDLQHNFSGIGNLTVSAAPGLDDISIHNPLVVSTNDDLQTPEVPEELIIPEDLEKDSVTEVVDMETEATPAQEIIEEEQEQDQEEEEETCVFAAARAFKEVMAKKEKKAKRKSVRFFNATPQRDSLGNDESMMTMNMTASLMFNDSGLAKASNVVHTPVPKHPGFKMAVSEGSDCEKTPPLPTPMALRDISMRAQECLADLYKKDEEEEDKEITFNQSRHDDSANLKPQALFQDDDDEYTDNASTTN